MAVDWLGIETEYRGTTTSVLQIAKTHMISEGAVRARAKREGWVRDNGKLRRSLVVSKMSGITNQATNYDIRNLIEQSANQDAADMNTGLAVARGCLCKLLVLTETCDEPKQIKVILDANKTATETIRRIRGLDEETDERARDVTTMSVKELEEIARGNS